LSHQHFHRFLWPTFVHHLTSIPIDPVTNFNLVHTNTVAAPLHTCQTNCLTAYALVSRAYRTPRRYSCIEHPQSWPRSPGSRTHTISGPTADNHQSYPTDAEFHASFRPCIPVRANVLLAFPLTRLRLSVHLRRSPSISRVESFVRLQLHLQHDSLVEDQSTPRPVDFKLPCVDRLESTLRHCMLKRAPLRHAPRVSTPQNLDSISPHAPMSLSPIFTVRLPSPTQPSVSTATMLHLASHQPEHCRALPDTFWYMIFMTYYRLHEPYTHVVPPVHAFQALSLNQPRTNLVQTRPVRISSLHIFCSLVTV
jgi:hypothetical protein